MKSWIPLTLLLTLMAAGCTNQKETNDPNTQPYTNEKQDQSVNTNPDGPNPSTGATPSSQTAAGLSPEASAGQTIFQTNCATCHGPKGLGDGPAAAALNPKPRNLHETKRSDEELHKIIKEGGASVGLSSAMPAWGGTLKDPDIQNVIAYIHHLKEQDGQ